MKKKLLIIIGIIFILIASFITFFLVNQRPISKKSKEVTFTIEAGRNKLEIVDDLKNAGIIRSKIVGILYVFFTPKVNLQAGTYFMDLSSSTSEIIKQISVGETNEKVQTVTLTFIEGQTFTDYATVISEGFDYTYDEIIAFGSNKEFLNKLIDKYFFIDESILNEDIYYPLEGYLYPNTYEFYSTASLEDIFYRLLDEMDSFLLKYKADIEKSKFSVHELLTIASIIEKEGLKDDDRAIVSQVIYKRIEMGTSLGMDTTTYYAVGKDMSEKLTADDLAVNSPYNTRSYYLKGLPVGPICNSSGSSIKAALNPSDTDYYYFVANVCTKEIFYFKYDDSNGFYKKVVELRGICDQN